MKHTKVIAAIATAGSLFAMSSAHAIVPAAAAAIGALAGAAVGTAASSPPPAQPVAVVQPPAVAVAPSSSTVVMGGPPVVQEVIPAPGPNYHWEQGRYVVQNGATIWVTGHWVPND
jgi:hypothetical protein